MPLPRPLPRYHSRDPAPVKSNLNAGALQAAGISPSRNAAPGLVLFARSPLSPFPSGLTLVPANDLGINQPALVSGMLFFSLI